MSVKPPASRARLARPPSFLPPTQQLPPPGAAAVASAALQQVALQPDFATSLPARDLLALAQVNRALSHALRAPVVWRRRFAAYVGVPPATLPPPMPHVRPQGEDFRRLLDGAQALQRHGLSDVPLRQQVAAAAVLAYLYRHYDGHGAALYWAASQVDATRDVALRAQAAHRRQVVDNGARLLGFVFGAVGIGWHAASGDDSVLRTLCAAVLGVYVCLAVQQAAEAYVALRDSCAHLTACAARLTSLEGTDLAELRAAQRARAGLA